MLPDGPGIGPFILAHSGGLVTTPFPPANRVSRRPSTPFAPSGNAPRRALGPCARGREARPDAPCGCASGGRDGLPVGHTCPERTPALPKDIGTMWRAVPGGTGPGRCAVRRRCPGPRSVPEAKRRGLPYGMDRDPRAPGRKPAIGSG